MKKVYTTNLIKILLFAFTIQNSLAQSGLKGKITNQKNEPLPFASVSVKGTANGTIANEEGNYFLSLQPGDYEVVFQYLGYQTGVKKIQISGNTDVFDAVLAEQALELGEVRIGRNKEDPAYAIMRRAIAKSRYHLLQVDSYKAKAYTKSSIVITDLPLEFLYKKELEKVAKEENFKKGVPILNETVSEIEFKQPNIYKQKVIASRNSQDNSFTNPNEYLLTSFYKPEIVQTVSPLSPKAFAYYKFEYQGTFRENGVDVSKIKITPRAYGDGVFKGTIHIIEDSWAIHSLDLQTSKMGINLKIRQLYAPVDKVWMPIQQQFNADGGLYGLKGKADYVISQTFQSVKLNPNFPPDIVVLDTKTEKAEIKALPQKSSDDKQLEELLGNGQKLSAKNLRKAVKKFEKQQLETSRTNGDEIDLVDNRISTTEIDSLATSRNRNYWDSLRTVPLTNSEIVSYRRLDSLVTQRQIEHPVTVAREKTPADTTSGDGKKKKKGVSIGKILFGTSFPLNKDKSWRMDYFGPVRVPQFNTVEGLVIDGAGLGVRKSKKADKKLGVSGYQFSAKALLRYSLERNLLSPRGELKFGSRFNSFTLEGGRSISQFNSENPISYLLNSVTTLFFEQNFAKIYEKDALKLAFNRATSENHFHFHASLEFADRTQLDNAEKMNRYRWINWRSREFTSNTPELESGPALLSNHRAFIFGTSASYKPWQKYRIKNGITTYYDDDSPEFRLAYRKGIPELAGSSTDFDFLEFGIKQGFETGIRSKLYYQIGAGGFMNQKKVNFADYRHFSGNKFFFQLGDPVGTFRMLDYYRFSTDRYFVEGHILAEFRQLLLTQLQWFRLLGVKETVMGHYLHAPQSKNYTELGYGLDVGIRFPFRIEIVNSFEAGKYRHTAFRIGTTMNLPFQ